MLNVAIQRTSSGHPTNRRLYVQYLDVSFYHEIESNASQTDEEHDKGLKLIPFSYR